MACELSVDPLADFHCNVTTTKSVEPPTLALIIVDLAGGWQHVKRALFRLPMAHLLLLLWLLEWRLEEDEREALAAQQAPSEERQQGAKSSLLTFKRATPSEASG